MPADHDPEVLAALLTAAGRALVADLTPYDPDRALARLSAARADPRWADRPEVVAAAATQARLRTRATSRFPGPARWWTPDGLDQASRPALAARHARRYVGVVPTVFDLGCGAGSDALALAAAGLEVVAVDRDPGARWALSATARDRGLAMTVLDGDVEDPARPWNDPAGLPGAGCFVDPARRHAGRRLLRPEQWSPPWHWVVSLAQRVAATGAKVAPGIDHAAIPRDAQVEWTSVAGDLLAASVWFGPLRRGSAHRCAAVLGPDGAEQQLDDSAGVPVAPVGPAGRWLVEPDPAVIRAGLVSVLAEQLDGRLLDPRIAYIVMDAEPAPTLPGSRFEVLAEVPAGRKQMRAWLRARGFGDVVVKKRGLAVVPEQVRASLRLGGDGPTATLVLTRTAAGPLALLVRRVA